MTVTAGTPADRRAIAEGKVLLKSKRMADARMAVPRQLPGIVIFIHGVNDPGSAYETVEKGLCEGLNERLDRCDLRPGLYGEKYREANSVDLPPEHPDYAIYQDIRYDPDTYLYARTLAENTHSVFVPFTWGYRASQDEIARAPGSDDPLTLRGQYQDVNGNRLDKHFAKQGGFFSNATTTLNGMYGPGFRAGEILGKAGGLSVDDYTYVSGCPDRRYFILAAERLAALIASMRGASPGDPGDEPDETITVIGHSQGTMLALLAQALLASRGMRTADTLILVDTPYSLQETAGEFLVEKTPQITTQSRLRTLVNIVEEVCRSPHVQPPPSELQVQRGLAASPSRHGGRTGLDWSPQSGKRKDLHGGEVVFAERDNRGKVYLYFCPQDETVALFNVRGLGTFGVPETIEARLPPPPRFPARGHNAGTPRFETLRAFDRLADAGLRQRIWSRALQDGEPMMVGLSGQIAQVDGQPVPINGEPLTPPYRPQMYGGEAEPGNAEHNGYDRPDDVSIDTALGNPNASHRERFWRTVTFAEADVVKLKKTFNDGKAPDDQTDGVRTGLVRQDPRTGEFVYDAYRLETPNETRAWRRGSTDRRILMENSYHSAILRSTENHRWVTAMDVAIGQARRLDDPDWRDLWLAMGDWRMPLKADKNNTSEFGITELRYHRCLRPETQELIEANANYYWYGIAPPDGLLSGEPPPLVDRETTMDRQAGGMVNE